MKSYNIVWAVVDSVRRYPTDGDDRSRLDFMDTFAKEAVEFKNVVTSAPSTVMSISAMMTSLPSYYLGRNYNDFRFDNEYIQTLSTLLKSEGYCSRALIMHREIREKLRVFDLLPRKYWPKGYSHKDWWNNAKILRLLKNTLRIDGQNLPQPCFWFLDFNCRKDSKTSEIVSESFKALEAAGYTKENTIYILCSDHGYPDPRRGITPEELKAQGLTHDIFMTDDNIMIPLSIQYPGCNSGQKVIETVSSLDIFPTIIDILDIQVPNEVKRRWKGKSLLPLVKKSAGIEYDNRKIRTDARFMGQSGRVTAIRGDKYKYVYYHDTKNEEFIDISNIDLLEKNIASSSTLEIQNALNIFKTEFLRSETEGINFQIDYSVFRLKTQLDSVGVDYNNLRLAVIANTEGNFANTIGVALRKVAPNAVIDLYYKTDTELSNMKNYNQKVNFVKNPNKISASITYDIALITYDSGLKKDFNELQSIAKLLKVKKKIMIDLNMSISLHKGQILRYLRTLLVNKDFYVQEPLLVFSEILRILKIVKNKFFKNTL
jgi:hypothetical protein